MIILLFYILLLALFLLTIWIIFKLKYLINKVNKLNLDLYIFQQKLALSMEKIKQKVTPKPKKKLSFLKIGIITLDMTLSIIFKKKYEKIKDVYEFLKATMA